MGDCLHNVCLYCIASVRWRNIRVMMNVMRNLYDMGYEGKGDTISTYYKP